MKQLFARPRHAGSIGGRRPTLGRVILAPLVLAAAVVGFGGGAHGDPSDAVRSVIAQAAPTTPLPTPSGGQSAGPAWVKGGGLVSAPKSATTILQPIQVLYTPTNFTKTEPGQPSIHWTQAWIYPFSAESRGGTYGHYQYFIDIAAHTLAFGALPVSLTFRVSEPLNGQGQPTPLQILEKYNVAKDGTLTPVMDPQLTGELNIQVLDVTIDGQPLTVGDSCITATPASLVADAKFVLPTAPFTRPAPPSGTEEPSYGILNGGELRGTLIVPSFSGCHNGSENLDALFDTAVSGEATLWATATGPSNLPTCEQTPPPEGTFCGPLSPLPLPTNPVHSSH